jgi:Domain of unknown function (DUF6894)
VRRCFFHVMNSHRATFQDKLGRPLIDVEHAKRHAAALAKELDEEPGGWDGHFVVITDDWPDTHGRRIADPLSGITTKRGATRTRLPWIRACGRCPHVGEPLFW